MVAKAQAAGLMEFADWILKTPYATTPMRLVRCYTREEADDNEVEVVEEGLASAGRGDALQHLGDSVGLIWGALGVWAEDARYLTLHGGVSALGVDYVHMQQELAALDKGLSIAALQLDEARDKARLAWFIAETLGSEVEELHHSGTSPRAFEVI